MTVTLTRETEIDVTLFCADCGGVRELDFDFDQDAFGTTRIFVTPCPECAKTEGGDT